MYLQNTLNSNSVALKNNVILKYSSMMSFILSYNLVDVTRKSHKDKSNKKTLLLYKYEVSAQLASRTYIFNNNTLDNIRKCSDHSFQLVGSCNIEICE